MCKNNKGVSTHTINILTHDSRPVNHPYTVIGGGTKILSQQSERVKFFRDNLRQYADDKMLLAKTPIQKLLSDPKTPMTKVSGVTFHFFCGIQPAYNSMTYKIGVT